MPLPSLPVTTLDFITDPNQLSTEYLPPSFTNFSIHALLKLHQAVRNEKNKDMMMETVRNVLTYTTLIQAASRVEKERAQLAKRGLFTERMKRYLTSNDETKTVLTIKADLEKYLQRHAVAEQESKELLDVNREEALIFSSPEELIQAIADYLKKKIEQAQQRSMSSTLLDLINDYLLRTARFLWMQSSALDAKIIQSRLLAMLTYLDRYLQTVSANYLNEHNVCSLIGFALMFAHKNNDSNPRGNLELILILGFASTEQVRDPARQLMLLKKFGNEEWEFCHRIDWHFVLDNKSDQYKEYQKSLGLFRPQNICKAGTSSSVEGKIGSKEEDNDLLCYEEIDVDLLIEKQKEHKRSNKRKRDDHDNKNAPVCNQLQGVLQRTSLAQDAPVCHWLLLQSASLAKATELNLNNCELDNAAALILATLIGQNPSLIKIHLMSNFFNSSAYKHLSAAVLDRVYTGGHFIDIAMEEFHICNDRYVGKNPGSYPGDEGVAYLSRVLRDTKCQMRRLIMTSSIILNETASKLLANAVMHNQSLTTLALPEGLNVKQQEYFVAMLQWNRNITTCNSNAFGEEFKPIVEVCLRRNQRHAAYQATVAVTIAFVRASLSNPFSTSIIALMSHISMLAQQPVVPNQVVSGLMGTLFFRASVMVSPDGNHAKSTLTFSS